LETKESQGTRCWFLWNCKI